MNSHDWNLIPAGPAARPVQRPKHRPVVRGASMLNSVCVATQVGDIYLSSRSSEPRSLRPWLNASLNLHIGHAQADYLSRFPEAHGHVDGRLAVSWSRNPRLTRRFLAFRWRKDRWTSTPPSRVAASPSGAGCAVLFGPRRPPNKSCRMCSRDEVKLLPVAHLRAALL